MAVLKKKSTATVFAAILLFCIPALSGGSSASQEILLDLQNIQRVQQENRGKPDWAASGLNLLVPGAGYLYLGEKNTAAAFFTTDLVIFGSFLFTRLTSTRRYEASIGFARIYAHTQSRLPYDHAYWSYLSNRNFMNVNELNWAFQNNREFDRQFIEPSEFYSWDSPEARDRYAEMRREAGNWRTASTLMLGTLALNRLVSFVSARVATRRYNDRMFSAPTLAPTADLENKSVGVAVVWGR
jgi:hypothetical protein